MTLFLDSALPKDAERALSTRLIGGITTNPKLIAAARRPATELIAELCGLSTGVVFYQLVAASAKQRRAEAEQMLGIHPRVGLKIACTFENLQLAAALAGAGHIVGMTTIFSPAQVFLACEAGVRYVLPYVNRSTRLLGDGPKLVEQMRAVIDATGASTEILAASVKSPEEAVQTLLSGAHHLTLPLALIETMGGHELSVSAIEDFAAAADHSR